jgi:uncharacterized membrane protein
VDDRWDTGRTEAFSDGVFAFAIAPMRINLVLLMAIAFLPFPTRLVAEAIRNPDAERAAVMFYGGWLLVTSLLFSALWAAVASDRSRSSQG